MGRPAPGLALGLVAAVAVAGTVAQRPEGGDGPPAVGPLPGAQNAYPHLWDATGEPRRIKWLHIQKCGTPMVLMLYMWGCPRLAATLNHCPRERELFAMYPSPQWCDVKFSHEGLRMGHHHPLRLPDDSGVTVTMLRDPIKRIVSAFNFGVMTPQGLKYNGTSDKRRWRDMVLASPQPLVEYAFFPAMKSCQTKMLLGFWCARDVEVTSAMVQEAKRRLLEEVVFFGLTEEWEATTQLFHKMLGGAMHHCDRHAARTSRATDTTVRRSYELLLSRGYRDEPDEQRCAKYGIPLRGEAPIYSTRLASGTGAEE